MQKKKQIEQWTLNLLKNGQKTWPELKAPGQSLSFIFAQCFIVQDFVLELITANCLVNRLLFEIEKHLNVLI